MSIYSDKGLRMIVLVSLIDYVREVLAPMIYTASLHHYSLVFALVIIEDG